MAGVKARNARLFQEFWQKCPVEKKPVYPISSFPGRYITRLKWPRQCLDKMEIKAQIESALDDKKPNLQLVNRLLFGSSPIPWRHEKCRPLALTPKNYNLTKK